MLRWIKREDKLQSCLSPPSWGDALSTPTSPFVKQLGSLSRLQRVRNFRLGCFDVLVKGDMPHSVGGDGIIVDDAHEGNCERSSLFSALADWSTQIVVPNKLYVKDAGVDELLPIYGLVEVSASLLAPKLFSISVEVIGGSSPQSHQRLECSVKDLISASKDFEILEKQMSKFLLQVNNLPNSTLLSQWRQRWLAAHFERKSWELVKDPELRHLLTRRRSEIGNFHVLNSSPVNATFGKFKLTENTKASCPAESYFVQYQIEFDMKEDRLPVVVMHVESESGSFALQRNRDHEMTRTQKLFDRITKRDLECSIALNSRTELLSLFGEDHAVATATQERHVDRLVKYSSCQSRKLRFFREEFLEGNKELEALTEQSLLSGTLGARVAKLNIPATKTVADIGPGSWFVVLFDRDTTCLLHLLAQGTPEGEGEDATTYREMTFFTFRIRDLYCVRDDVAEDVADDDSTDDHVSEYLALEEYADAIEDSHGDRYARASYLAVQRSGSSLGVADLKHALSFCAFVNIGTVYVSREHGYSSGKPSKLLKTIQTILKAVPGSNDEVFYYSATNSGVEGFYADSMPSDDDPSIGTDGLTGLDDEEDEIDADLGFASLDHPMSDTEHVPRIYVIPPLYVQFALDGVVASVDDLASISHATNLSAYLSVFKSEQEEGNVMSSEHYSATRSVRRALDAYVAEQTLLERLHDFVPSHEDADFRLVRRCLRRAQDVVLSCHDLHFYVSKADRMVAASMPAPFESEMSDNFALLRSEFQSNSRFDLLPAGPSSFLVVHYEGTGCPLSFWCFISLKMPLGIVTTEVFHPAGWQAASSIVSATRDMIATCSRRANQFLLLKRYAPPKLLAVSL